MMRRMNVSARLLRVGWWLRLYVPPDRRVLEDVILPHYAARSECRRILFVGVHVHTRRYERLFAGRDYVTLDPNRFVRRFGAARHIVDGVEHMDRHFADEQFDLIVLNGVIGWGLDDPVTIDAGLRACHACLARGGELMIGLNEGRASTPPLGSVPSLAFFEEVTFPPLGRHRYAVVTPLVEREHTFYFFRKRFSSAVETTESPRR